MECEEGGRADDQLGGRPNERGDRLVLEHSQPMLCIKQVN